MEDFGIVGLSHFQLLLEVGILYPFFCHEETVLKFQHNLEVAFHLQICRLWSHEVTGLGAVALELPRQIVSPEIKTKHIIKKKLFTCIAKIIH